MKPTLLLLAVCVMLFSCKKHTSDNPSFWQCDNSQTLDSAATFTHIVGAWKLIQQRPGPGRPVTAPNKNVTATFHADSTFTVRENSTITAQGNWKLYLFTDSTWALNLTSPSPYLYGFISFCNNKVLFTDSWVDGSDNLFEKIN